MIITKKQIAEDLIANWIWNTTEDNGDLARTILLGKLNNMDMRYFILARLFDEDPTFPAKEVFEHLLIEAERREKHVPNRLG